MAEQEPELKQKLTLAETALITLSKPGSLARQAGMEAYNSIFMDKKDPQFIEKMGQIMRGERVTEAEDLVKFIEKTHGVDLTAGDDPDNRTPGEKIANFARDLAVDIATSPDTLAFGGASKMLGMSGASKLIAQKYGKTAAKAAERAAVGASLGIASTTPDDNIADVAKKALIGGAVIGGAGPLYRASGAGDVLSKVGDQASLLVEKGLGGKKTRKILEAEGVLSRPKTRERIGLLEAMDIRRKGETGEILKLDTSDIALAERNSFLNRVAASSLRDGGLQREFSKRLENLNTQMLAGESGMVDEAIDGIRKFLDDSLPSANVAGPSRVARESLMDDIVAHSRGGYKLKSKREMASFFNSMTRQIDENLIGRLKEAGASPEEIGVALERFDEAIAAGGGGIVGLREDLLKAINKTPDSKEALANIQKRISSDAGELAQDYFGRIREHIVEGRKLLSSVGDGVLRDDIVKQNFNSATDFANEIYEDLATTKMLTGPYKKEISTAMFEHVNKNKIAIAAYNEFAERALNKTIKDGDVTKAFDYTLVPISMHTADISKIDEFMNEVMADFGGNISKAIVGARRRTSDVFKVASRNISRAEAQQISAQRYANLFMLEREHLAAQKISAFMRDMSQATGFPGFVSSGLKLYDSLLNANKAAYLTLSSSWLTNNLPDNVFKAFTVGGLPAGVRAFVSQVGAIPRAAILGATDALAEATAKHPKIHSAAQALNIAAFKAFDSKGFIKTMMNISDPTKSSKALKIDNDWLRPMIDAGVIESDIFTDAFSVAGKKRLVDTINIGEASELGLSQSLKNTWMALSEDALPKKLQLDGQDWIDYMIQNRGTAPVMMKRLADAVRGSTDSRAAELGRFLDSLMNWSSGKLDSTANVLWKYTPIGRIGPVVEQMTRYHLFREVFKSLAKTKYAGTGDPKDVLRLFDELGADVVMSGKPDLLDGLATLELERKIQRAGAPFSQKKLIKSFLEEKNLPIDAEKFRKLFNMWGNNPDRVRRAQKAFKDASRITSDAMFDYGNIAPMERYFFRRMIPFWTFSRKSMNLLHDVAGDPTKVGRLAKLESFIAAHGRIPDKTDRARMTPQWLRQLAPVIDEQGRNVTFGSSSFVDTMKILDSLVEGKGLQEVASRSAPFVKSTIQEMTNVEPFTGRLIRPSEGGTSVRDIPLMRTGFGSLPADTLQSMGLDVEERPETGQLFTRSPDTAETLAEWNASGWTPSWWPLPTGIPLPQFIQVMNKYQRETGERGKGLTMEEFIFREVWPGKIKEQRFTPHGTGVQRLEKESVQEENAPIKMLKQFRSKRRRKR